MYLGRSLILVVVSVCSSIKVVLKLRFFVLRTAVLEAWRFLARSGTRTAVLRIRGANFRTAVLV